MRGQRQQEKLFGELPPHAPEEEVFTRARAIEAEERGRIAEVIRHTLGQIYFPDGPPRRVWGFKEIWMTIARQEDWAIYDEVFPTAMYAHLIRHPFAFARSVADWNRVPFKIEFLREQLTAWVDYLHASRVRIGTGRYWLLTYEALAADPRGTLTPLLELLGLAWDDGCRAPLGHEHVRSPRRSHWPAGAAGLTTAVPGLGRLMAEFGYRSPLREEEGSGAPAGPVEVASPMSGGTWRLNPPFAADGPRGWVVPLTQVAGLQGLAGVADDLEHLRRSPLALFEAGRPLGPAHSLHHTIREEGRGRYSHWRIGHDLLFSTSDNSDPNRNGRAYTIAADCLRSVAAQSAVPSGLPGLG